MVEGFRAYGEKGELPIVLTRHQKEDHYQGSDVHPSVESKSTDRTESTQHSRESQGKDGGPEQTGRDSPRPIEMFKSPTLFKYAWKLTFPFLCGSEGRPQPSMCKEQVLLLASKRLQKDVNESLRRSKLHQH